MANNPSLPLAQEDLDQLAEAGEWRKLCLYVAAQAHKVDSHETAPHLKGYYTAYAPRMAAAKDWQSLAFLALITEESYGDKTDIKAFRLQHFDTYAQTIASEGNWDDLLTLVNNTCIKIERGVERASFIEEQLATYGPRMAKAGAFSTLCDLIKHGASFCFQEPAAELQFVLTQAAAFCGDMLMVKRDVPLDDKGEDPLMVLLNLCQQAIERGRSLTALGMLAPSEEEPLAHEDLRPARTVIFPKDLSFAERMILFR